MEREFQWMDENWWKWKDEREWERANIQFAIVQQLQQGDINLKKKNLVAITICHALKQQLISALGHQYDLLVDQSGQKDQGQNQVLIKLINHIHHLGSWMTNSDQKETT